MEMTIAILLWLQLMFGGQSYTQAEYDQLVQQNEVVINQINTDPIQQSTIWQLKGNEVPSVIIGELD